jgi:E3 ubiquitin-protein ligase HECTD2
LIDQCITAYIFRRLQHDYDSSLGQSLVLESRDIASGGLPDNFDLEDPSAPDSTPGPLSPIHLTEFPIDQQYSTNTAMRVAPSECNHTTSNPYSTSSPGTFLRSHMEQRHSKSRSFHFSSTEGKDPFRETFSDRNASDVEPQSRRNRDAAKSIFKPLEDYVVTSFATVECINSSFSTSRPGVAPRTPSEGVRRPLISTERFPRAAESLSEMDAKTLLLGDVAENGFWWTGERSKARSPERPRGYHTGDGGNDSTVTLKSPRINWTDLNEWYHITTNPSTEWRQKLDNILLSEFDMSGIKRPSTLLMNDIEDQILAAQAHTQRMLLKATETLLKRPGRPLREPDDIRFLLIILANPLLYPSHRSLGTGEPSRSRSKSPRKSSLQADEDHKLPQHKSQSHGSSNTSKGTSGQHSGIIKRIMGLLSNVPNECHHHLVSWFARLPDSQFQRMADLISSFVTYRLTRQHGKKQTVVQDPTADLIPSISGGQTASASAAMLHATLGVTAQPSKKNHGKPRPVIYNDDWQIKASARVMALFFSANNSGISRRGDMRPLAVLENGHSAGLAARERAHNHGQILPTSDFYNTLLDYSDLIADFEAWEARRGKFSFCQYPFFLSIWAKIQIMEHDARRQMEVKAREAWFDSIMTHKSVNQYLVLKIRRDCLVEDSLKRVSEVVGSGGEEIKKGLRIEFKGEEGIDVGGLRKEWFLLLVRDIFNPEYGLFPVA